MYALTFIETVLAPTRKNPRISAAGTTPMKM
jgi:hypothetical protein